jgi:hypothetical protein
MALTGGDRAPGAGCIERGGASLCHSLTHSLTYLNGKSSPGIGSGSALICSARSVRVALR